MQTSAIASVGCLALQVCLIAFTVWYLPTRLTTKRIGVLIFIAVVPVIWLLYAVVAMLLDGVLGHDVPGVAYLLLGLISGGIGFSVYVCRRSKEQKA